MTEYVLPLCVGVLAGVLSGYGVGGGTLLLVYLTAFAGMEQAAAQGINLLYFLPAAGASLPRHLKNGFVAWRIALPAAICGLAAAGGSAWIAASIDVGLLRRGFGIFLIVIGLRELFRRGEREPNPTRTDTI